MSEFLLFGCGKIFPHPFLLELTEQHQSADGDKRDRDDSVQPFSRDIFSHHRSERNSQKSYQNKRGNRA